jgi:hypothetical protein
LYFYASEMSLAVRKATAKGAIAVVNDSMCDIVRFVNETTQGVEDYDVQLKKRNTFTHFTCTTEDPETGMKKIAEVHSCIRTEHTLKSQTKAIMEAGASAAETGGQMLGDVKQYVAAQVCMATSKTMTGVTSTSRKIGVGAVVTFGGACNFLKRSFVTACKVGLMIADDADANKRARVHDASGDSASGDSGEDAPADEKAGVDKKKVKDDDPDSAASVSADLNQERNDQQSDDGIEQGEASASGDSASGGSASAAKLNQERNDQQSDDGIEQGEASASGDSASGDSASGDSASGDSASGDSASGGSASAANASAANASAAAGMSVESLINSDSAANASGH